MKEPSNNICWLGCSKSVGAHAAVDAMPMDFGALGKRGKDKYDNSQNDAMKCSNFGKTGHVRSGQWRGSKRQQEQWHTVCNGGKGTFDKTGSRESGKQ